MCRGCSSAVQLIPVCKPAVPAFPIRSRLISSFLIHNNLDVFSTCQHRNEPVHSCIDIFSLFHQSSTAVLEAACRSGDLTTITHHLAAADRSDEDWPRLATIAADSGHEHIVTAIMDAITQVGYILSGPSKGY